ncbi:metalloregulator ArsR/SmtB family transcription factor [Calothrix sp. UHCC 0171]|uniref:ArsR/SmtB family transcription factor n=1 Tax=Calothrix sp. UHCC 0171 TaxID=3110245 RepID=UPI002B21EB1D|nr:metalloregulator ArsR/SmtB family transcription factor [Calothrix sp. UHCC 0171]MEA5574669.1 metalloregulator ArsR/SmtB family transcription factor [Calothrix sp. UHCC 0171]
MSKTLSQQNSPELLAPVAEYFKVLAETSRLQILSCLRTGAMNVTEMGEATGLGQPNLSKHLKVLTQAGLISRQQKGVSVYYAISDPVIFSLCELVCDRIGDQIQKRAKEFEQIKALGTLSK